jgi:hypothetical protein
MRVTWDPSSLTIAVSNPDKDTWRSIMNKRIAILAVSIFALVASGTGTAIARNTDNDVVLKQNEYHEYFKQERAHGKKNHMYTESSKVPAPPPGLCVVVTGDSEQGIAISCNYGSR